MFYVTSVMLCYVTSYFRLQSINASILERLVSSSMNCIVASDQLEYTALEYTAPEILFTYPTLTLTLPMR